MATALRACATTRVTRACERNSALFAAVLANETFQQTLLDELDVDSLAHTAAACVAGRAAVEALGDEPWLEAIKAIERDLTHGELPPAEAGEYSSKAARAAGEAAHAHELVSFKSRYPNSEDIWLNNSCREAYASAHRATMNRAAKRAFDKLSAQEQFGKLLVWAQECVARSRVFHNEAANSWGFGSLEEFDRFAEFMDTSYYELAMQLALRHYVESDWRCMSQDRWTPEDGTPWLDCIGGWGADLGTLPGRAELAFRHCSSYYDHCHDRDTMCELISGGRPSKVSHGRPAADDPMEFDAASGDDDDEDSDASDSAERYASCGSYAQLRALAAPFPFHASTKAMLGPRLLDTLRGLRGADVELPPDIRDMIVDLPDW